MGLDAYFVAKFKDNTPKEVLDKYEVFHEDYDDDDNPLKGLLEVGYFRKMWGLQDLIENECHEGLSYDHYYFNVPKDALTDIYMYLWNLTVRKPWPTVESWEQLYDIPIDNGYFDTYGELNEAERGVFKIVEIKDYIDKLYYYASW